MTAAKSPLSRVSLIVALFATVWSALTVVAAPTPAEARPLLSPIFGDNMVLQRGKPNTFWGWSDAGTEVRVTIAGTTVKTVAAPDGRWQAQIQPPAPGGPYTVAIDGPKHQELHEVLVGDVWLCGGQSNMGVSLGSTNDGAEEIKAADHPLIRLFKVAQHVSYGTTEAPEGKWKICSPATMSEGGGFSAVAYYFGRRLQADVHVPIGLIQDCVGGTPAETWMSPATMHQIKDFAEPMTEIDRLKTRGGPEYGNYVMHWYDEFDIGSKEPDWAAQNTDDAQWQNVKIPGGFQELGVGGTPAVCWFRKEIILPDPLPAGKAKILLGVIEKMDTTYINGQWIGASSWVENPRAYPIGDGVLKPGKNVVTVRVFKLKPNGGFQSPADKLQLVLGDGKSIPLAGEWKGKLSVDAHPPHPLPLGFENYPIMPTVLYQGMIRPVAPLAITGFIWYQGEANSSRAYQYRQLLPAMIRDWRQVFQQGDLPFYIAGLPAFMQRRAQPGDDSWAELREAQAMVAAHVTNSGLATAIDTGEADNIHPKEKKPVGERLALCALQGTYGLDVIASGPTFEKLEPMPGALKIHFAHTDGGLIVKGEKAAEFAIAGADHQWFWADARLEGNTIVVSSAKVPQPVAVRYAWQSNPAATLFNGAGLPTVPFRTDDWPGITENAKPW